MFTAMITALISVLGGIFVPLGFSWLFDWLATLL